MASIKLKDTVHLEWLFFFKLRKTWIFLTSCNHSFRSLMNKTGNKPTRSQVARYVEENFSSSNELLNWTLPDWTENPSILKRIHETKYREWARALNGVWKELARKINPEVAKHPERHSLIYVQNGFIVPGGRFKGKKEIKKKECSKYVRRRFVRWTTVIRFRTKTVHPR